jgi:hypothetical protein
MDSRFSGNDKEISVLIGVDPRLKKRFEKTKPMLKWVK